MIPPGIYRNPFALIWVCDYDEDGDGDLNIVIGGESGSIYFFRRDCIEGRENIYSIG